MRCFCQALAARVLLVPGGQRLPLELPFRKNEAVRVADLPLRGAGGEPVDFARTIVSHGVAELPPNRVDLEARPSPAATTNV